MLHFVALVGALLLGACQTTGTPQRGTELNPIARPVGPQAAKGAVLFMSGQESGTAFHDAERPTPDILEWFVPAGFDVFRLNVAPQDRNKDAILNRYVPAAVQRLRAAGYGKVYFAGQSVGGFVALLTASREYRLTDGAIAFAPGWQGNSALSDQVNWHRTLVQGLDPARRVAIFHFRNDELLGNWHAQAVELSQAAVAHRRNAIVRVPPNVSGHEGFNRTGFAATYGKCLVEFLIAAEPDGSICPP